MTIFWYRCLQQNHETCANNCVQNYLQQEQYTHAIVFHDFVRKNTYRAESPTSCRKNSRKTGCRLVQNQPDARHSEMLEMGYFLLAYFCLVASGFVFEDADLYNQAGERVGSDALAGREVPRLKLCGLDVRSNGLLPLAYSQNSRAEF